MSRTKKETVDFDRTSGTSESRQGLSKGEAERNVPVRAQTLWDSFPVAQDLVISPCPQTLSLFHKVFVLHSVAASLP
jgi:hypothetical protein